ncbi:MAG TPA: class I SAM-dependent methyltransferase, partial [Woeseiaceae bacterium]
ETDMRVMHVEDFGTSYAKTLAHWRERLFKVIDDVRHLGYSDEFIRLWHYYLSYCEGAFLERATGVVHMLMSRPHFREDTFGP